jgi:hypothetical protein
MFENTILQQISHHLKDGETAEFFNGTLFLTTSKDTARDIYIDLCNIYRKRFVQFSFVAENEFAIDFVVPTGE